MLDLGSSLVHWTTDSSLHGVVQQRPSGWTAEAQWMDSTLLSATFNHREELKLGCEGEDGSDKASFCV